MGSVARLLMETEGGSGLYRVKAKGSLVFLIRDL